MAITHPPDYYVREISTDIVLRIKIHTAVLKYIRLDVAYMGACLRTINVRDYRIKMRPPLIRYAALNMMAIQMSSPIAACTQLPSRIFS